MDEAIFLVFASGAYESDGIEVAGYARGEDAAKAICDSLNEKRWTDSIQYDYMELEDLTKTEI